MATNHPAKSAQRLGQQQILLLAATVGAAIIGISWTAMMWDIRGTRPDTHFLNFAQIEIIPTGIMIFSWIRTHRELATKSLRSGSLGWLLAGAAVAWMVLQFSWGFGIDAGDENSLLSYAQADTAQAYFFGGWAVTWLLYTIGIAKRGIDPSKNQ